ncbi:MAG: hypothetical protein AAF870_03190, partial [Pseudomonadota bacterium]
GAPIRIFIIIGIIWILGRIAWGSDAILSKNSVGLAEIDGRVYSSELALKGSLGSSWRTELTAREWLKLSSRVSEIDPAKDKFRTNDLQWHRNLALDNSIAADDPRVNEHIEHQPYMGDDVALKASSPRSELCCKKQFAEENQNRANASASKIRKVKSFAQSRLSAYFWLFARESSSSFTSNPLNTALQQGTAQYGGSQAGGILTYRLSGDLKRNIAVYSLISTPLVGKRSGEVGLGVKIKPVRNIPISLYAEKRLREKSSGDHGTAVFLAGGSGPDELISGTFLETYGQAGYVFQNDSSYFFDGYASVQKKVSTIGVGQVSMGGAVWTGGQEGAHRVDVGPRVSIEVPIGNASTRISIDWRQRVAGNAEPDSGLAITFGSSF